MRIKPPIILIMIPLCSRTINFFESQERRADSVRNILSSDMKSSSSVKETKDLPLPPVTDMKAKKTPTTPPVMCYHVLLGSKVVGYWNVEVPS